jgi:stress response protein YsnF
MFDEKPVTNLKTAAASQRSENIATATMARDEVLRLAEEEITVGKRVIPEGATRVHRFVVDKPVEAQVTLHEERARVVRRPISDSSVKEIDWTDKTIEVTETAEEAVVNKTVHVIEEVLIGKEGRDHVETVRDKVRHQEIEVEHLSAEKAFAKKA